MNRLYLLSICIALLCHFHLSAQAQTDSSQYDLGRVKLSKNFTQSITIKGSELEKMPFANLSEAINVWLSGTYSNPNTLLYVIDGNLASDVNALNILDIEDLTLIQNALIEVNGVSAQQQLVLVRTKRNHFKKSGFTISGQTAAVSPDLKTKSAKDRGAKDADVNYYHQYYLSAWHNSNKLQFGLSANYQRDVSPSYKSDNSYHFTTTIPSNFNLFRFYAWLSYKLDNKSTLSVGANFGRQKFRLHETVLEPYGYYDTINEKSKEPLLNTWLQMRTDLSRHWKNEFNISYVTASDRQDETISGSDPSSAPYYYTYQTTAKSSMFNLVIRDHFSYEKEFGSWHLGSSLNVMFRYIKADWTTTTVSSYSGGGYLPSVFNYMTQGEARNYLITPAINISYKNSFEWQAGLMYNATKNYSPNHYKRYFPFTTLTLDLLRLSNPSASNSLKVFASIAETSNADDLNYSLQNFASLFFGTRTPNTTTLINYSTTYVTQYPTFFNVTPWMGSAGASLSVLHNRLQVSYNFEKKDFIGMIAVNNPYVGLVLQLAEFNSYSHRLGITAKLIEHSNLHWLTGLNFTSLKDKGAPPLAPLVIKYNIGDYGDAPSSWTGGWVNRLQFGNFSAGLDILYHINESTISTTSSFQGNKYDNHNSIRLQNLYAGWSFKVHRDKRLEAYATFRNLVESSDPFIADTRKFYGLGARLDW